MTNNNVILITRSELYVLSFPSTSPFCQKKKRRRRRKKERFGNFVWRLDERDKRGVCYGEVVACVSGVEERKKGVGMGRDGKGFLFSFSFREIA